METYEMKKAEYLKRLKKYTYVLDKIQKHVENGELPYEYFRIMTEPLNENELRFANATITLINDTELLKEGNRLSSSVTMPRPKSIEDFNSVNVICLIKRIMIALKNRDDASLNSIKKEIEEINQPEGKAELTYEFSVVIYYANKDLISFLFEELDVDSSDLLSLIIFEMNYVKAINDLQKSIFPKEETPEDIDILKFPEELDEYERYVNRFHELYRGDFEYKPRQTI